ncbi:uncharacterized protein LOC110733272 [Chenopodium quinoa]|uniref:uncharacterized protein LOC110733272 n=1 Tax=Chenopodium quinoa TaxID=63459 RepID=UPI000B78821D|nr:uncharacterized protein LOC110733272 [Chenopodium quinoa]
MAKGGNFWVFAILILGLLYTGFTCDLNNIQYEVERSERIILGEQEWNVTMLQTCPNCSMSNITFRNCNNWLTVEPVDPTIFSKDGDKCVLIDNNILKPGQHVNFSYAWDTPVVWIPDSAVVIC